MRLGSQAVEVQTSEVGRPGTVQAGDSKPAAARPSSLAWKPIDWGPFFVPQQPVNQASSAVPSQGGGQTQTLPGAVSGVGAAPPSSTSQDDTRARSASVFSTISDAPKQPLSVHIELVIRENNPRVFVTVTTNTSLKELFTKIQRRINLQVRNHQVRALELRPEAVPDAKPFFVRNNDPDTWKACLRKVSKGAVEEVELVGHVVVWGSLSEHEKRND
ncbi:hypothetical protein LTR09_009258 [Extremus antarcticus]|uniref:Uncharacterized protein n=1 Tax=Extremus antarcticus TaxID=702011 RepID=A0AAJ0G9A5_9PEZI|nr:hypothetical protein LTR09_009258 [Extremus antarcticus]